MTKIIICLFSICFTLSIHAQPVVYINAGSRASYGNYQDLTIYADGTCVYSLRETNGERKDSSSFTISRSQLDSFFLKADQTGFFNLNARYDGGLADGSGILISLNNSGRKHSVHVINTDVPAINELINWFNTLLVEHRIRIYYGQKQQP